MREFAAAGVTVDGVVPGLIGGTDMAQQIALAEPPVGRAGTANEVAQFIRALCRPTSGFLTDRTIHVSGGQVMS